MFVEYCRQHKGINIVFIFLFLFNIYIHIQYISKYNNNLINVNIIYSLRYDNENII